ncbi:MAG: beta-ketoacyl-ACP synthase III [Desulfuromonadales bacterium]|jgi:3-oxoacyl-[acyl-carrier-protein] synthase-3
MRALITGTGSYVPEKVLTNQDFEKYLDTTDEWIVARTGIRERHIAAENENTSDLCVLAARNAIDMAGIKAEDVDLIIVATITGDYPWPATACIVQDKIGARQCGAYDISAACSGFIYALNNAVAQIESGAIQRALVIGAETLSRIVDYDDRNTCLLFGDAAGAVVLEAREGERGILSSHLHADGSYLELLYQPGFGSAVTPTEQGVRDRGYFLKMQGNEVFKVAVKMLAEVAQEALEANDMTIDDIALLIPHQANIRILEATAKRMQLPAEKVYINVDRFGNTSAATIPLALDEANRAGKLKENDIIVLNAFGGGFTWASACLRW